MYANDTKIIKEFDTQFNPIKSKILDINGYFSFSDVSSKLKALFAYEDELKKIDSKRLIDLYDIYTLVLSKKEGSEEELIKYIEKCLNIYEDSSLISDEQLVYFYYRASNGYEAIGNYNLAIKYLKKFIDFAIQKELFEQEIILAQKEELGYLYQENEEYKKALETNLDTLKKAEILHIKEDKLVNLYNNISENYYSLKEIELAKMYLNKRLETSIQYEKIDSILDALFKLAIISFETKDYKTAELFFKKRVEFTKQYEEELYEEQIRDIQEDLDTFYIKYSEITK